MASISLPIRFSPEGVVEVEFVRGSGATQALLTLSERDIRKIDARATSWQHGDWQRLAVGIASLVLSVVVMKLRKTLE